MILCECGEFIEGNTFKEYIKTSINPSTPTIGHSACGLIFDFIDDTKRSYSSRKELKELAMRFAGKRQMTPDMTALFLLEVERLKSAGKFSDRDILAAAAHRVIMHRK
ncbi:MAG TPA: hypothetical protein HA257_05850 [Candidatus Methanoperedenaceae archaeon]|nr:hypothetical protein [Candidatus Methanoperedenaceae archaeon]